MIRKKYLVMAAVLSAFGLSVLPVGMPAAYAEGEAASSTNPSQIPVDIVSQEVGVPLKAAQESYKQKKYQEALDKLNEASAVKKTPYETYAIDRTRAAVATAMGDDKLALESYLAVVDSGKLTAEDHLRFMQAISSMYFRKEDYAQAAVWVERFFKEGGVDPKSHDLLIRSYYLNNDFVHANQELQNELDAAEKAGVAPSEDQLHILINLAVKQNDKVAYVHALEKIVAYYPKKEYWIDLLNRLQSRPDFSPRLMLDIFRLKFSMGLMSKADEYADMAELAMVAGFPAEAKKVMEAGYKSGALGVGSGLDKQKSLLNLATKKSADDLKTIAQTEADVRKTKDGIGLINLGYVYVTTDQFEKGLAMMEQGVNAPGLKHAEEAKLHLATAYAQAGRTPNAIDEFKTVQGNDGATDLARYWVLHMTHPTP